MDEHVFPKSADDLVATLADIFRHQNQSDVVELLESASAHLQQTDYDRWNGGTYTYELMLDVPVSIFARIEPQLTEVEKGISAKLSMICRGYSNDHLSGVTITPLTSKTTAIGPQGTPSDHEAKRVWSSGAFRLFISHVSAHKVAISDLKDQLKLWGICGFVAHEDITPSLEWQDEIELALRSMHALAAMLTPDFHESNWTDQEIGFALGRGILVVPVRVGANPYGFIGKVQGLSGSLQNPVHLANLITSTLLANPSTRVQMRAAISAAFAASKSYSQSIALSKVIVNITDFNEGEMSAIHNACLENNQVFNATGVVTRIRQAIGMFAEAALPSNDGIPF